MSLHFVPNHKCLIDNWPYNENIKGPHYWSFVRILLKRHRLLLQYFPDYHTSSRCRHNGRDGVSNHQPHDCLLNRLFRHRSKKRSKLRVTGLCAGNSPGTGEFPAQMASNAEKVSIWWRHHHDVLRRDAFIQTSSGSTGRINSMRPEDACVSEQGHHWFRQWLAACSVPSHYLNQ